MAARTVEARLLISGEDRGAAAAIGRVTKAIDGVARAGKVSAEVKRLTDQLNRAGEAARAAERVRAAGNAVASAGMGFKTAEARVKQLSAALDAARAAARQFEGVKALNKSGAIAQEMAQAAARVKDLDTQLKGAQRALKGTASAMNGQVEAARAARSALNAYGVPVTSLEAHQRALKGTIEATTKAIRDQNREAARTSEVKRLAIQRRQEVAAQRAALGDQIAAHRARVLQDTLERRQARRDAWKGAAGIVGLGAVHKAEHFGKHALHTYQEFDNERRFGKVVMGLTDDQQKPLVDQAIHMGATTRYNDVQVLEAQRELAARGLNKDQVLGLMSPAADLGQSLDLRLPDAVKQMEGAIFGFKKDISTVAAATASARQTADVQVKAAKISGMTPEDISQTYKYGATSARLSGVSEQTLLAFGGISKKANMGGEEAGVAFRALIANAQSPTQKAREAMLANGLDYKTYQKNPVKLDEAAFTKQVAASYGVELDKNTRAGISKIFSDKALIASPEKFTPAIMDLLSDNLGGDDAKSKKSIAGLANRFRNASMQGVDTNALIADLMKKLPGNLALANAIFGPKQGNRIANALGDPETLRHMIEELLNHSEGYAAKVSTERMAGFDGAVKRFQGAVTNVETKLGRAWDNDGKGGALTWVADKAGHLVQSFAELDNRVVQATTVVAALGTAFVGVKSIGLLAGGFGLKGSAVALAESAAALNAAAARLGVSGVPGAAAPAAVAAGTLLGPAAVGAGIIMGGSVASVIAKNAVENEAFADPYLDNPMLGADPAGYAFGAAIVHADRLAKRDAARALPRMSVDPGQAPLAIGRGSAAFGLGGALDPDAPTPALPQRVHPKMIDAEAAEREAKEAGRKAGDAFGKAVVSEPLPSPRPEVFEPMKRAAGEAGTEAGTKTGEGIRSGIETKAPEVEQQGRSLFERLKDVFSEGIKIPISLASGDGSGGGGLIQKASFGGGSGGLGGMIRRSNLGGDGAIPSGGSGGGSPDGGVVGRSGGGGISAGDLRGIHPEFAAHIRASALSQGIDPDIAMRIANSEGLRGSTPNRLTPGDYEGGKPTSFGPFQLHYGRSGGLGNRYTKETGHHAGDPTYWREQVDFALRIARREGWGAWYGRKGAGIGLRDGIGTVRPVPMSKAGSAAAPEASVSPGLDGKAGIDLGNGTLRMPDGRIRSKTLGPPGGDPSPLDRRMPEGESPADRMERAAARMEEMNLRSHHTVEVQAAPGLRARTKGMSATGSGPVKPNVGVSMPAAEGWNV